MKGKKSPQDFLGMKFSISHECSEEFFKTVFDYFLVYGEKYYLPAQTHLLRLWQHMNSHLKCFTLFIL
jgi:hypothetical protein